MPLFSAQKGWNNKSLCYFQMGHVSHLGVCVLSTIILVPFVLRQSRYLRCFVLLPDISLCKRRAPTETVGAAIGERLPLRSTFEQLRRGRLIPGNAGECPELIIIQPRWIKIQPYVHAFHTHLEFCRSYCLVHLSPWFHHFDSQRLWMISPCPQHRIDQEQMSVKYC